MEDSIIEKQIGLFRKILNKISEDNKEGQGDFIEYTNNYFNFDTDKGWNILMNAFYVFEDTELAKHDFNKFGLQGPARHKNIGEKYLRLYGILNSCYQQYLALINLIELFKLTEKSKHNKTLKESDCIKLRNKIAAHPSNYSSGEIDNQFDVYEISRPKLEMGDIRLTKNQENSEEYNIEKVISDFDTEVKNVLSKILEKFLKKKYNNEGKLYEEYQKLEKLREGAVEIGEALIEFKNSSNQ